MLVGAEPKRPSASYKLNTLVSNRIRGTSSGKTEQHQEMEQSDYTPSALPPGRLQKL